MKKPDQNTAPHAPTRSKPTTIASVGRKAHPESRVQQPSANTWQKTSHSKARASKGEPQCQTSTSLAPRLPHPPRGTATAMNKCAPWLEAVTWALTTGSAQTAGSDGAYPEVPHASPQTLPKRKRILQAIPTHPQPMHRQCWNRLAPSGDWISLETEGAP